jgi:hypothetical protein
MTLSPTASVQGHQVDICLSPIYLLSMESHHLLVISILPKTPKMQVMKTTMVQNIEKMVTTHQKICGQLGAELIRVRRIGSSMVLYEVLNLTWRNAIPSGL